MRENINKVSQRGERLDSLQDKTDNLAVSAQGFRRGANRVRKQMWWKGELAPCIGYCGVANFPRYEDENVPDCRNYYLVNRHHCTCWYVLPYYNPRTHADLLKLLPLNIRAQAKDTNTRGDETSLVYELLTAT